MAKKKTDDSVTRRDALKGIAAGVGAAGSLPVLNTNVLGQQDHAHPGHGQTPGTTAKTAPKATPPKFFNAPQMALIATVSELIIPTDDHSKGAIEAEVPAFIDLMVSESPAETKKLWTDGLAALDQLSKTKFQTEFNKTTKDQQTQILTEISKNERSPKTTEERFFRAIKNLTIDGYYTSKIGIHDELRYKGNTYLKEFKGCTHPEHING
jgi:Gluconate 2-dehydrogenase subunit 3